MAYRGLQNQLVIDSAKVDLIKDGGGIRKLRYALQGRGKSGGIRVIYYLRDKETALFRQFVKDL